MTEENKPAEVEQAEKQPEAEAPKKEKRRSLTARLYQQIDIMEREQARYEAEYTGIPRLSQNANLAFAKQITETANAIINIKRGGK